MAGGWSRDGAVQEQIDVSIEEAVKLARNALPQGESLAECEECGEAIPLARQQAIQGVRTCIRCQTAMEKNKKHVSPINRRGSKDSQLK